jgi:hypothetical protein
VERRYHDRRNEDDLSSAGTDAVVLGFLLGIRLLRHGLLLFCAILAWQLAKLPADVLSRLALVRWALAACFVAQTILTWVYVAPVPAIFSAVTTLVLVLAAKQDATAQG